MCLLTSKPTYLILKAQTTAFNAEIRLDYILQSPPVSRAIYTDASDQTARTRETSDIQFDAEVSLEHFGTGAEISRVRTLLSPKYLRTVLSSPTQTYTLAHCAV